MRTLLHPTDFSANSEMAFTTAVSIARDQQARLIVLHVVNPRGCTHDDLCGDQFSPVSNRYRRIWNDFDQLKQLARDANVSFCIRIGQVFDSIVDVATHEHCDMIVLGERNQGGDHDQRYGCLVEGLIRCAPCSVLTLRPFYSEWVADSDRAIAADVSRIPIERGSDRHPKLLGTY